MEPIVEPLELTPSVSSSSKVTIISRFTDCKLSDRKAGSKGISVNPRPFLENEKKKRRSPDCILNHSKDPGPLGDSGALIEENAKNLSSQKKKPQSKMTSLKTFTTPPTKKGHIQPTVTGFHSPLDDGTRKSQPLTKGKPTNAKDAEGNTQPVGIGLPSIPLDEVTSKSKPFLKGRMTDPKDSEGNKKLADMGLPYTVLDEGINKTKPLPEGANIKDKNSERFKPFTNMKSSTPPVTVFSRTDAKYQVDQTQSTRFEVSVPDQHQAKILPEVDRILKPSYSFTVADIQALLEEDKLLEESYDDVLEAEEEMDEDIQEPDTKETQTHHSTEHTTEEPISIEH
ncbi:hypothetical protein Tco_0939403 [Tanacetum coccineum]|uniref:Uncharacterized protein n=1 Tax=Tanacetum coccineum TaxID=301880 RepID=A0ABQ5DMJ8_9ASTR